MQCSGRDSEARIHISIKRRVPDRKIYCCRSVSKPPTFVIPMAPMFPLYEVVGCPAPTIPEIMLAKPSVAIPRLTACGGGASALDSRAAAK